MIEDELLKWKFKAGSKDALQRIYEKYRDYLLTLAMSLVNDAGLAEDIVHDVFVSFAQSAGNLQLRTNLKSYLMHLGRPYDNMLLLPIQDCSCQACSTFRVGENNGVGA